MGIASPSISLSRPAMIFNRVDLPEPFKPNTPILAPGKKLSEISFKIWRLGGTVFPTRFIEKTYWAMRTLHFQKFTTSSGDESSIIVALKWSRNHKRRPPTAKKRAKPTIIKALLAISRCDSSNLLREEPP